MTTTDPIPRLATGGTRALTEEERDALGRLVREAWVNYCRETGDTTPSHLTPYDDLGEWDKEADRRIGEAVRDVVALLPPGSVVISEVDGDARESSGVAM